ncbi:MAG: hypothetical protein Q4F95_07335 [Oscillospiraceae bacterium]|nr:hypothetical protein [Oscillospiraceae bacterium]
MSTLDLEKLAASGSEMPENLNGAEQLFYLSLRQLYAIYRTKKITREIARKEKTQIYKQYEINSLNLRSWEAAAEKERKLAVLSPELKKTGCELCRKYSAILGGLK